MITFQCQPVNKLPWVYFFFIIKQRDAGQIKHTQICTQVLVKFYVLTPLSYSDEFTEVFCWCQKKSIELNDCLFLDGYIWASQIP